MKPKIIIIDSDKNGKIILSKSQLEEIIDMAYNDGYSDGCRIYYPQYIPFTNPCINTTTTTTDASTISQDEYKKFSDIIMNSILTNGERKWT